MTETFENKLCVITGAASGIGRALAIDLAGRGAALALSDVNEEGLEETKAMIGEVPSNRIRYDRLDVADADAIERYAATIAESLGDADYVFNNAGLTRVGTFDDSPLSSFEKIMDVNFWGVVRMSKAFLPQLKKTRGALVNISSLFGLIGYGGQSHYCASKFAVRGFNETIAQELKGTGVGVVSVHPGGVATNIARNATLDALPDTVSDKSQLEQRFDAAARTSPAEAAAIILRGTEKRKKRVMVGKDAMAISFLQRLFPESYGRILKNVMPKNIL